MRYCKILCQICLILGVLAEQASASTDLKPITTDSRIKTFIYNENEIFKVLIHTGFQSSIEFANGEEVETISIGEAYAWKLTPIGRRLFIKPLENNIHTNVTVITNRRTYQFEIRSKSPEDEVDEELCYVVRFYYP